MFSYIAVGLLSVWIVFMILIWTKGGLRKGRKFGNKIAKHLGLTNNFFHSVLDNGTSGPSLQVLATLETGNLSVHQASVELGPSLNRGLAQLETKFGPQEMIENAKPVVMNLVREWEELRKNS